MLQNIRKKSDRFILVITAYISILLILILTLISVLLSVNYNNFLLSLIYSYSKDNLSQISYSADFLLESANTISRQVFFDSATNQLIYVSEMDDFATLDALNRLNNYLSATNFLESVYIYNPAESTVAYASLNSGYGIEYLNLFYDRDVLKDISLNKYTDPSPIVRETGKPTNSLSPSGKKVYTFALVNNRDNSSPPDGAIILNFSADWLYNTIRSFDKSPQSTTFIIDAKGLVVTDNSAFHFMSDISDQSFVRHILNADTGSGYFIADINGLKSFITFVSSGKTNWKYIRIIPYAAILSNLDKIRMTSLLVYIAIILVGITASVLVSKKLYKPYNSMSDRILKLEGQNRNSYYYYKQDFLQSLLSNSDSISYAAILHKFKEFNIKLAENNPLTVILYKIDRYYDFCNKYNFNDRNIMKFGMTNIASELCAKHCVNESVVTNSDHIVLIISTDDIGILKEIGRESMVAIQKSLEISCSIVIGSSTASPENLSELYNEVLEASFYRIYKGHGSIIHAEETIPSRNVRFVYPEQMAKQLLDSIMLGRINEAKKIYGEILDTLKGCDSNTFIQAITQLALEFGNTANALEKSNGFSLEFNINTFILELNKFETLEDINHIFMHAFDEIADNANEKKNRKHNKIVEDAIKIIHEEYWDPNISLESISDRVNVSSSYLRLLLRRFSNHSFSDYLSEIRMGKVKELLKTTTLSINEISDRTGFINLSYFFTVFKKINGITPNEYRQSEHIMKISK